MKTSTIMSVGAITIIGVGLLGIMLRKPPVPPATLPTNYISPNEVGQFPSQAEEPIYSQPPASQTVSSRDMPSTIQPSINNKAVDPSPIPIIPTNTAPPPPSTAAPSVSPYLLSPSQGSTSTDSTVSLPPTLPPMTAPPNVSPDLLLSKESMLSVLQSSVTTNANPNLDFCQVSNPQGVKDYDASHGTFLWGKDLASPEVFASWLTGTKTKIGCFPTVS